jgi:uncharacterized protein with HEPN domain
MKRDFRLYLKDFFDAIDEIEEFTKNFTINDFVNNKMAVRAIITDLIIIGEAVDKIPKIIKYDYLQQIVGKLKISGNNNLMWEKL